MAFSEFEIARVLKATDSYTRKHGPPARIKDQLAWEWDIDGQSVVLNEVRPHWKEPSEVMRSACIKTTYIRSRNTWRIYWMRQDLKWHSYEPNSEVSSFDAFLKILEKDEYCCFFG